MDRNAKGQFIKGHKQLAHNQHVRIRGKLVSRSEFYKYIDRILCMGSGEYDT